MDALSVSRLKLRQTVHQPSAQAIPTSAAFWLHIYPGIISCQKKPNLAPLELMRHLDRVQHTSTYLKKLGWMRKVYRSLIS